MTRFHRWSCVPLALCAALLGGASRVAAQPDPPQRSIPDLVRDLGATHYQDREAAHKALLKRDEALASLYRAMPGLNAEARFRARAIQEEIGRRRMKRFLQYAREGRVDLLAEWSATAGKQIDAPAYWQCVLDVAWGLLQRSRFKNDVREWSKRFPAREFADFVRSRPTFISDTDTLETARVPTHLTVRSLDSLSGKNLRTSIVVCNNSVTLCGFCYGNILIATGDVTVGLIATGGVSVDRASDTVIIADGDVQLKSSGQCVIAARGKTSIESDPYGLSSGRSRFRNLPPGHLLLLPEDERLYGPAADDGPAPSSTGVRFFETADIGLKLAGSGRQLRVVSVQPGSPPAKAGLMAGDMVVEIDGHAVARPDAARRLLRHGFVLGGVEVSVKRAGKPLTLPVSFFGWELPPVSPAGK